ncbi:MAG TPA: hypothetical protein VEX68_29260 [Bryobacteraceae bacterium]|nr:hypothetical protein [Bryobacteraceae bacterium]
MSLTLKRGLLWAVAVSNLNLAVARDFKQACQSAAAARFGLATPKVQLGEAPPAPDENLIVTWSAMLDKEVMKGHCLGDAKSGKLLWMEVGSNSPVQFDSGASSKVISGSIKGYETVNYVLKARAGQTMTVKLAAKNASTYFTVIEPGADSALHHGTMSGNTFQGTLKTSGDYRVKVFMMRNAARRTEVSAYTLTLSVTGR